MKQIVGFSGGGDSTSMVLRLHELGEQFDVLFTPTGDELPDLEAHLALVAEIIGKQIIVPPGVRSLDSWIEEYNAVPNVFQRWCTRQIKILPCIAYLRRLQAETGERPMLLVGLRADEEAREGLYGEHVTSRFPLREWGWDRPKVYEYLGQRGIKIPERTDCARCPYQRIGEWFSLWKKYPDRFQRGIDDENKTGHTYRTPGKLREDGVRVSGRDTWPQSLKDLRAEFERGRIPKGYRADGLKVLKEDSDESQACRVCRM